MLQICYELLPTKHIILSGNDKECEIDENTIRNRLNYFIEKGLSKKDATEVVADEYKINKNIVYKIAIGK